jgi:hypothetical protein
MGKKSVFASSFFQQSDILEAINKTHARASLAIT